MLIFNKNYDKMMKHVQNRYYHNVSEQVLQGDENYTGFMIIN